MSHQDAMSLNLIWRFLSRAQRHATTMRYKETGTVERLKFAIFAQIDAERVLSASNTPEENIEEAENLISETNQVIDEDKNLKENIKKLIEEADETTRNACATIKKAENIQNTRRQAGT